MGKNMIVDAYIFFSGSILSVVPKLCEAVSSIYVYIASYIWVDNVALWAQQ